MAEKKCCNLALSETDQGIKLELTGEEIKNRLSSLLRRCRQEPGREGTTREGCC